MSFVAYLPARGGSKRIPRKNIRDFHGSPALSHVIGLVKQTGCCARLVVSTDDTEIGEVASSAGATILPRDARYADDHTDILTLVKSDLARIRALEPDVHTIACVFPTALLMSSEDLHAAVNRVRSTDAGFVVSVGRFHYPIQRALRQTSDGSVEMADPSSYLSRSQDLEPRFHDAGQFYVGTTDSWERRTTMFDPPPVPQPIHDLRVCDVDVEEDWHRAEVLWELLGGSSSTHG